MAGFKTDDESGLIGDINVTPFVDVALVLLIIFMSTSVVIVRTALDLEIPVASNAQETEGPPVHSVLLKADGSIQLNGEQTSTVELERSLKAAVQQAKNFVTSSGEQTPKETQVLISARGEHDYQEVVHLIDLVKGSGVGSIALNTKVDDSPTDSPATGN